MNSFAIYTQAQQTLARNPKDQKAQLIVSLWGAIKATNEKNTKLQEEVTALRFANAQYARKQDMLESKIQRIGAETVGFDAAAFLKALHATPQA